jgi:hypothetical protein
MYERTAQIAKNGKSHPVATTILPFIPMAPRRN